MDSLKKTLITTSMAFSLIATLASAQAAESLLTGISADDLDQMKLTMEARLQAVSGHPVLCKDEVKQCIESYDKLIGFDWTKSTLQKGKKIIVSRHLPSGSKPGYDIINTREPADVLKRFLGSDISSAKSTLLSLITTSGSPSCPDDEKPNESSLTNGVFKDSAKVLQQVLGSELSTAKQAPLACPDKEKYYDDFFKDGDLDITIVWGYFDEHEDTFKGYLTEQLFRTRKVGIFLDENNKELKQMLDILRSRGFQVDTQGTTDWHLSRPFNYNGKRKTARVHLYNSTVKCAGEVEKDGKVERYDNNNCPEQVAATEKSLKAFSGAFGKSQVVIYNGHSRLGRGPDFGPLGTQAGKFPIALWALDDVNLNNNKTLLFLGSCNSLDYFQRAVDKKKRALADPEGLKLLGIAGDGSWGNSAIEAGRLIQGLLEARCPQDITDSLNLPRPSDWNYQIDFMETSKWMHSREPKEAKNKKRPNTSYELREDRDGDEYCFEIRTQQGKTTETLVDDQRCAVSYTQTKSNDGQTFCFLADNEGVAFGQPVDDDLCKDDDEAQAN